MNDSMNLLSRALPRLLRSLALPALLCGVLVSAQTPAAPAHAAVPTRPAVPARPAAQAPGAQVSDRELAETQKELIQLLRLSPTLTTVVSHDPSLLANQDYVRLPVIRTSISLRMCIWTMAAQTRRWNARCGRSCTPATMTGA